jgi:hypothetical protein
MIKFNSYVTFFKNLKMKIILIFSIIGSINCIFEVGNDIDCKFKFNKIGKFD